MSSNHIVTLKSSVRASGFIIGSLSMVCPGTHFHQLSSFIACTMYHVYHSYKRNVQAHSSLLSWCHLMAWPYIVEAFLPPPLGIWQWNDHFPKTVRMYSSLYHAYLKSSVLYRPLSPSLQTCCGTKSTWVHPYSSGPYFRPWTKSLSWFQLDSRVADKFTTLFSIL